MNTSRQPRVLGNSYRIATASPQSSQYPQHLQGSSTSYRGQGYDLSAVWLAWVKVLTLPWFSSVALRKALLGVSFWVFYKIRSMKYLPCSLQKVMMTRNRRVQACYTVTGSGVGIVVSSSLPAVSSEEALRRASPGLLERRRLKSSVYLHSIYSSG